MNQLQHNILTSVLFFHSLIFLQITAQTITQQLNWVEAGRLWQQMSLARIQSLFIVFHTEQLHQFLPLPEEKKKVGFAEQDLKIKGRKHLIYIFLISYLHISSQANVQAVYGKRKSLELNGHSKTCFHFFRICTSYWPWSPPTSFLCL